MLETSFSDANIFNIFSGGSLLSGHTVTYIGGYYIEKELYRGQYKGHNKGPLDFLAREIVHKKIFLKNKTFYRLHSTHSIIYMTFFKHYIPYTYQMREAAKKILAISEGTFFAASPNEYL